MYVQVTFPFSLTLLIYLLQFVANLYTFLSCPGYYTVRIFNVSKSQAKSCAFVRPAGIASCDGDRPMHMD